MKTDASIYGLLAEFEGQDRLVAAAHAAHQDGYRRMDAYTPFPVEGLAEAIGFRTTRLPTVILIGGLVGCVGGFFLQYWVSVWAYPVNIGGRPLNSWPAFIPVTFELTILGASLAAVLGMLALNKLPQPHHPVFNVHRFTHASSDRFFVCIEAKDPKFHLEEVARILQNVHAHHITEVSDD